MNCKGTFDLWFQKVTEAYHHERSLNVMTSAELSARLSKLEADFNQLLIHKGKTRHKMMELVEEHREIDAEEARAQSIAAVVQAALAQAREREAFPS